MYRRPPKLEADYALQVLKAVFRSASVLVGTLVLLLLLTFNWTSMSLYEMTKGEFSLRQLVPVALFLLLALALLLKARKVSLHGTFIVDEKADPQKCQALIVFLSPPGMDSKWLEGRQADEILSGIHDELIRQRFDGPWRMPVEAIAHHLEWLDTVVVIPSADAEKRQTQQETASSAHLLDKKKTEPGTWRDMDLFRKTIELLTGRQNRPRIMTIGEIDDRWKAGVDFEKVGDLINAVEQAYDWLNENGAADYEIMVDITGGQKVPAVAGAAMALGVGRRFQYVSRRDYVVRSYDVTYRPSV
ncbi:MAG: hypothetical protein HY896_10595 [Deltaproteobacteria bacterium]|nr:hypothetical protein [Deltaproteobacteria bacterium]